MKPLIIGARGMLGQAMMKIWSDLEPVGLDLPDIDITNPPLIAKVFDFYSPTVVINCAAYTAVDKCETDEAAADLVNGTAVGYLAKACLPRDIRLIHISTDYVFDGQNQHGYDELANPVPVSAYGRTKSHGEYALFKQELHQFYLVRTSWLYGPGGQNFVQTMINLGRTQPEVKVVNDQHGKPTFTEDLAAFIKNLCLDRATTGVYHGVNEGETTWYDFACEIFRQVGIKTPVKPVSTAEFPRPAKRPAWSTLKNTRRPLLRHWPEALRDYLVENGYPVIV